MPKLKFSLSQMATVLEDEHRGSLKGLPYPEQAANYPIWEPWVCYPYQALPIVQGKLRRSE